MDVGKEIICNCSKCKLKLSHMIESTYQGKILKVMCKTCKSVHIYRDDTKKSVGTKKSVTKKKDLRGSKVLKKINSYEDSMSAASGQDCKPYMMSAAFEEGDLINHPTFGMGMVEELLNGNIIVTFKDGRKTLVHNKG